MRALVWLALSALALCGCGHKVRTCKAGTVLLAVELPAGSDRVVVDVSIDGGAAPSQTVTLPLGGMTHGTIELDFSMYPAGRIVSVTVTAFAGGDALGAVTTDPHTLAPSCDALAVTIMAGVLGDLAGFDLPANTGDLGDGGGGGGSCATASDCPKGQACDSAHGTCTTSCSASQACNGGCCDGSNCVTGTAPGQCALGQALCGSCVGNAAGKACLTTSGNDVCGCTSASDCPVNQACELTTHTCGAACDVNTPCNGGCCSSSANGTCQTGTLVVACGSNGGVCGNCGGNQNGHVCIAITGGGQCGCNLLADCPGGSAACTMSLCVNSCSSTTACQSGCCSAASSGTCQPGTSPAACGAPGSLCQGCAGNLNGSACLTSGVCGCTKASDCPSNQACDTATSKCTTACNANQACNGGCCSASTSGTCVAGNSTAACGTAGTVCTGCPANTACATYSCNGSCVPSYAPSSTACAGASGCFATAYCTGSSAACPPQGPAAKLTPCAASNSDQCLGASSCNGSSTFCPPQPYLCTGSQRCCHPGCFVTCP